MAWLHTHARVVTLERLLTEKAGNGLTAAITFDDGYRSLHEDVAPVLKGHGSSATVYLTTGCISPGDRIHSDRARGHYPGEEFLVWDEVAELFEAGWTVGSHGVEHLDLSRLPRADIDYQVTTSKRDIEMRLHNQCVHFSYPWGRFNREVTEVLQSAGYRYAASGRHAPFCGHDLAFEIPRINIMKEYTAEDFAEVVSGQWDFIGLVQKIRRQGIP
jgi:peptidoglycan/xylan/chitin deacetylase (PgdA/CDA1 family)